MARKNLIKFPIKFPAIIHHTLNVEQFKEPALNDIFFNKAVAQDIPDLVALLTALFNIEADFQPDLDKQKKGLELLIQNHSNSTIQVARNPMGRVIGMVTAQLVISTAQGTPSVWIEDMVVESKFRGLGVGKQLLSHTLEWAKSKDATRAQLLVDVMNRDALGYYEHLGWETTQLQARRVFI